jgi:hypothetical protein
VELGQTVKFYADQGSEMVMRTFATAPLAADAALRLPAGKPPVKANVACGCRAGRSFPHAYRKAHGAGRMKTEAIVRKFLEDEALLVGGTTAIKKVMAELAEEGVTVFQNTVSNIQRITRQVLAVQHERNQG